MLMVLVRCTRSSNQHLIHCTIRLFASLCTDCDTGTDAECQARCQKLVDFRLHVDLLPLITDLNSYAVNHT